MTHSGKAAYSRILVKLSGEALMGEGDYGIDPVVISAISWGGCCGVVKKTPRAAGFKSFAHAPRRQCLTAAGPAPFT